MQYLQNEIVFSSENGWTMTTCHNMEEFFKSTVEWKNVDTNEDILYEHNAIYKKFTSRQAYYNAKSRRVVGGLWWQEGQVKGLEEALES